MVEGGEMMERRGKKIVVGIPHNNYFEIGGNADLHWLDAGQDDLKRAIKLSKAGNYEDMLIVYGNAIRELQCAMEIGGEDPSKCMKLLEDTRKKIVNIINNKK